MALIQNQGNLNKGVFMNIELSESEVESIIEKHFSELLSGTPIRVLSVTAEDPAETSACMSVACEYQASTEDK